MIDRLGTAVVMSLMLVAPAASASQVLTREAATCQAAVGKGLRGFEKAELKTWARCLDGVIKGDNCDTAKRDAAIASAIVKARNTMTGRCTDSLLFTAQPNGVGFAAHCHVDSSPQGPYETGCDGLPVGSTSQLADCLICWKEGELREFLKIVYPCLQGTVPDGSALACGAAPTTCPDPVAGRTEVSCLTAISRAGRKWLLAKQSALEKCLDSVASGRLAGPCPDPRTTDKLARAEQKAKRAIAARCSGVPTWWDVCPGGAPCGTPISTAMSLAECVVDSAEAIVDELLCQQYPAAGTTGISCPPTTTTSTTSTSLTGTTATTTTTLCNCCPSGASLLKFTTGTPLIGGGGCGNVKDTLNNVLLNIDCGGLYTGGGNTTVPLPSVVPDTGVTYVHTTGCSGTNYNLSATSPGDHAGLVTIRSCTSAGVADPAYPACDGGTRVGLPCTTNTDCPPSSVCGGGGASMTGCLFGPPLPLPNSTFVGASVCLVNRVVTSGSGSGSCSQGSTNLSLPLGSDFYLEGDLLDGSATDRPAVAGIQPCPICTGGTCKGGPRHGLACTPGSSALGTAYPTSHDCPPPAGALGSAYIGALPIPLNLTTDTSGINPTEHKIANNSTGQEYFCGFCANNAGTSFKNPPVACSSNAGCAGVTGCPSGTLPCGSCRQRSGGAFGTVSNSPGSEHEITLFGSPASVCLADTLTHNATLVGAFCIPPAFNWFTDPNFDLPGPGAVALIGQTQLIP